MCGMTQSQPGGEGIIQSAKQGRLKFITKSYYVTRQQKIVFFRICKLWLTDSSESSSHTKIHILEVYLLKVYSPTTAV